MVYDADLTGQIVLPTITLHAKDDPTVFVNHEAIYRQTVEKAGNGDLLQQNFSDEAEHSKLSTPKYAALFSAMLSWIDRNEKPTKQSVAALCEEKRKTYDEACKLLPEFEPAVE
ncbi:hypothetical protein D3C87_1446350 [compost metagenome]